MITDGPRFGFTIPQRGMFFDVLTPREMVDLARESERSGVFGSVWVGDSLLAKPRPEAITLLGAVAGVTSDVYLGVGCMASFPLRDPIVFAYQWATLDVISEGRTLPVVCTGIVKADAASEREGSVWGVADRDRAARMEEFMQVCRLLWSQETDSFDGDFYSFSDVTIEPKPTQDPVPIWIASNPPPGKFRDQSLRRVANRADGWMCSRGFIDGWDALKTHLVEAGKDPGGFPNVAYHNVNIKTDREEALDESEHFLSEYYGPIFTRQGVEQWTAAGSPEECARDLRELFEGGAKHVTLRITSWDQRQQFGLLVDKVLPRV